jgi:hypothetical protein
MVQGSIGAIYSEEYKTYLDVTFVSILTEVYFLQQSAPEPFFMTGVPSLGLPVSFLLHNMTLFPICKSGTRKILQGC